MCLPHNRFMLLLLDVGCPSIFLVLFKLVCCMSCYFCIFSRVYENSFYLHILSIFSLWSLSTCLYFDYYTALVSVCLSFTQCLFSLCSFHQLLYLPYRLIWVSLLFCILSPSFMCSWINLSILFLSLYLPVLLFPLSDFCNWWFQLPPY